jgi:hypothetical protein
MPQHAPASMCTQARMVIDVWNEFEALMAKDVAKQAVTIGARDDNTRALLLSSQRTVSKEVPMTLPPEPKLSYQGPMYLGDNKWNADGKIQDWSATAVADKQGALSAEHPEGAGKATGASKKHIASDLQHKEAPGRYASAFLRREAPGLANDVDTAGKPSTPLAACACSDVERWICLTTNPNCLHLKLAECFMCFLLQPLQACNARECACSDLVSRLAELDGWNGR